MARLDAGQNCSRIFLKESRIQGTSRSHRAALAGGGPRPTLETSPRAASLGPWLTRIAADHAPGTNLERLLEDISFDAGKRGSGSVTIDAAYVDARLADLARNEDLARFVL